MSSTVIIGSVPVTLDYLLDDSRRPFPKKQLFLYEHLYLRRDEVVYNYEDTTNFNDVGRHTLVLSGIVPVRHIPVHLYTSRYKSLDLESDYPCNSV